MSMVGYIVGLGDRCVGLGRVLWDLRKTNERCVLRSTVRRLGDTIGVRVLSDYVAYGHPPGE